MTFKIYLEPSLFLCLHHFHLWPAPSSLQCFSNLPSASSLALQHFLYPTARTAFWSTEKIKFKYCFAPLLKFLQQFLVSFRMKSKMLPTAFKPLNDLIPVISLASFPSVFPAAHAVLPAAPWIYWTGFPSGPLHMLFPPPGALLHTVYPPDICMTCSHTPFSSLRCHFIRYTFLYQPIWNVTLITLQIPYPS